MIGGQPAPVFSRRIAARPLPRRHLAAPVQRAVPVLRYLEKVIHPRWHTPLETTKRPCRHRRRNSKHNLGVHTDPLKQCRPGLCDRPDLVSVSRGRRLLLSIALLAAAIVVAVELMAIWETVLGAKWIFGLGVLTLI